VVDIDERRMVNNRPISGTMPVGSFSAGRMQVDLRDRRVVLEGRARLRIDQGVAKLR
jgi:lipopolysaccharide export system protein LptC